MAGFFAFVRIAEQSLGLWPEGRDLLGRYLLATVFVLISLVPAAAGTFGLRLTVSSVGLPDEPGIWVQIDVYVVGADGTVQRHTYSKDTLNGFGQFELSVNGLGSEEAPPDGFLVGRILSPANEVQRYIPVYFIAESMLDERNRIERILYSQPTVFDAVRASGFNPEPDRRFLTDRPISEALTLLSVMDVDGWLDDTRSWDRVSAKLRDSLRYLGDLPAAEREMVLVALLENDRPFGLSRLSDRNHADFMLSVLMDHSTDPLEQLDPVAVLARVPLGFTERELRRLRSILQGFNKNRDYEACLSVAGEALSQMLSAERGAAMRDSIRTDRDLAIHVKGFIWEITDCGQRLYSIASPKPTASRGNLLDGYQYLLEQDIYQPLLLDFARICELLDLNGHLLQRNREGTYRQVYAYYEQSSKLLPLTEEISDVE